MHFFNVKKLVILFSVFLIFSVVYLMHDHYNIFKVVSNSLQEPNKAIFDILIKQAQEFANNNEPKKALAYYLAALNKAEDNPIKMRIASFGIAKMHLWLENYSKSEKIYHSLLQQKLSDEDYEVALEGWLRSLNALDKSKESNNLIVINKSYQSPGLMIAIANSLYLQGKITEADTYLKNNESRLKNLPAESFLDRELSALKEKINVGLLKTLNLETSSQNFDKLILNAKDFAIKNEPEKALAAYQKALTEAGQNSTRNRVAKFGIGKMLLWLEKYFAAENLYKELLKEKLDNEDYQIALQGLIESYNGLGQYQDAIKLIPKNYQFRHAEMLVAVAKAYVGANNAHEAKKLLEKNRHMLSIIPTGAKLYNQINKLNAQINAMLASNQKKPEIENKFFDAYIKYAKEAMEDDRIKEALCYYYQSRIYIRTEAENQVFMFGIGNAYQALGDYTTSLKIYRELLEYNLEEADFDAALEGYVRSLSVTDQSRLAFRSIPDYFEYKTPSMMIAAAQAALWSGWTYKSMRLLDDYAGSLCTLDPKSNLGKQYEDVYWQSAVGTACNGNDLGYKWENDSDHFRISRYKIGYFHHFNDMIKGSIIGTQNHYNLIFNPTANGNIMTFQMEGWINDYLFAKTNIAPAYYGTWHPILWEGKLNLPLDDHIGIVFRDHCEVVESIPAIANRISLREAEANFFVEPFYRLYLTGSFFNDHFSDKNRRKGCAYTFSFLLFPDIGLFIDYYTRHYINRQPSPFYFSPFKYNENRYTVRLQRRINNTWRYYALIGHGRQRIFDTPRTPTNKAEFGLRGPFLCHFVLDFFIGYNDAAGISAAATGTRYARRYGGVDLQLLW